ncbi:MAG: hypothetical protein RLZZ272_1663 [Actinomycetota bacterium]
MFDHRRKVGLVTSSALIGLGLVLASCSPSDRGERIVEVTHGPVTAVLVDAAPEGASVGDVRYFSIMTAGTGGAGRLEAILSTTGMDVPEPTTEVRVGQLVFTFAEGQVSVLGASVYPSAGSTIAVGATTVRPVVGGSGEFAGVTGWCESTRNDDDTWVHVLHLQG